MRGVGLSTPSKRVGKEKPLGLSCIMQRQIKGHGCRVPSPGRNDSRAELPSEDSPASPSPSPREGSRRLTEDITRYHGWRQHALGLCPVASTQLLPPRSNNRAPGAGSLLVQPFIQKCFYTGAVKPHRAPWGGSGSTTGFTLTPE